jgi:hypothetical protein
MYSIKKNTEIFLTKSLGSDFLESLEKFDLWKPDTKSVTDHNELFQGLNIVPKVLMSFLIRELSPMNIDDIKEIKLPVASDSMMRVTKFGPDVYSGEIIDNNKKLTEFKFRPIPGIGLVILSAYELYDMDRLEESSPITPDKQAEINCIIDERLNLHSLINKVVDGKMMQKDAVHQLLMSKLNELQQEHKEIKKEHEEMAKPKEEPKPTVIVLEQKKKPLPLSNFVENRKKKLAKKEYHFSLEKSESIRCPDCWNTIFSEGLYSGCVCFGDTDKKLHIKKAEDGYTVRFGRGWDPDNIEMLLEVLRSKENG